MYLVLYKFYIFRGYFEEIFSSQGSNESNSNATNSSEEAILVEKDEDYTENRQENKSEDMQELSKAEINIENTKGK